MRASRCLPCSSGGWGSATRPEVTASLCGPGSTARSSMRNCRTFCLIILLADLDLLLNVHLHIPVMKDTSFELYGEINFYYCEHRDNQIFIGLLGYNTIRTIIPFSVHFT